MRLAKARFWHSQGRCERCGSEPLMAAVFREELGPAEQRRRLCERCLAPALQSPRLVRLEELTQETAA